MIRLAAILGLAVAALVALGVAIAGDPNSTPQPLLVASDTAAARNPLPFWGRVDCDRRRPGPGPRHQTIASGGDPQPRADGVPQGDEAFRRLTVFDGDHREGERCELGLNDHLDGPTSFYREGLRLQTYASLRLPQTSDPADPDWRVLLQMKQAFPYNNLKGSSRFELQLREGRWLAISNWRDLWSAPAEAGVWTRFRFDITYSQDPSVGSVQVAADLNADGDFDDAAEDGTPEQGPAVALPTLLRESAGPVKSKIRPGGSVPSHLRAGIYQNRNYSCPRSGPGCFVDVDNVQVLLLPD